jgi:hypothetical protein
MTVAIAVGQQPLGQKARSRPVQQFQQRFRFVSSDPTNMAPRQNATRAATAASDQQPAASDQLEHFRSWLHAKSARVQLFLYSRMINVGITELAAAQPTQVAAELERAHANVDTALWDQQIDAWLANEARTIDWSTFPHLASEDGGARLSSGLGAATTTGGAAPATAHAANTAAQPASQSSSALSSMAPPVDLGGGATAQMLSLLQQLTDSVNDLKRRQDELDATLNEHGGKKAKAKSLVAELAKQPSRGVMGDASGMSASDTATAINSDKDMEGKDAVRDMMSVLKTYHAGVQPLTIEQRLLRHDLSSVDATTIPGMFLQLRQILRTLGQSGNETASWNEVLDQNEAIVAKLFEGAIKHRQLGPHDKARLEHKFVTIVWGKAILGSKKVGFVEAAGSAQAEVMKDNHVTPEFPWGGAPWGGRGKGARVYGKGTWHGKGAWQGKGGFPGECWECGKPGHRSADCSATSEERDEHKKKVEAAGGRGGRKW